MKTEYVDARKRAAKLARELRSVKTPALTIRERNGAIRSHVRQYLRNKPWEQ